MWNWPLLILVTVFYAGYNFLVKISSGHVPQQASTTILLTITLQTAAITCSILYLVLLLVRGGHSFELTLPAFGWAAGAGIAIGAAEICYFYLFSGAGGYSPAPASIVIPFIVSGTILLTMLASIILLGESASVRAWIGAGLVIAGIAMIFSDGWSSLVTH